MITSNIKLLPHVLVRLGGMSFDVLKSLELSDNLVQQLQALREIDQEFDLIKSNLINHLKTFSSDYIHFKSIRKLKKIIYKEALVTSLNSKHLNEDSHYKILIYNDLINKKNTLKNEINILFNNEYWIPGIGVNASFVRITL